MIINSPLSDYKEVLPLIEAGANSFYCGITSDQKINSVQDPELINRRPDYGANFTNINDLYKAKQIADKYAIDLTVVFNEFYPQSQLEKVKSLLKNLLSIGINKIVIADIGMLKYVADNFDNIEVTISIMSEIFNSHAISLIKEIHPDIKKITLPYHLDFQEQKAIISDFPEIIFETFIFNELCHYEVGLCNFTHSPYRKNRLTSFIKRLPFLDSFCQNIFQNYLPYSLQNTLFRKMRTYPCYLNKNDMEIVNLNANIGQKRETIKKGMLSHLDTTKMIFGCGVCFIPQLYEAGIKSLKIGGRNNSLKKKINNVRFINTCIKLLQDFKTHDYKKFQTECEKLHLRLFSNGIDRNSLWRMQYCYNK